MKKRSKWKYIRNFSIGLVACMVIVFVVTVTDVFGIFVSKAPYVEGAPQSAEIIVTSEGGTQKGTEGSGAKPCSDEIPTAVGKKGTESNPFLILEVVPDKAMQQMTYLTGNRDAGMPKYFDMMQLGIDACNEKGKGLYSGNDPLRLTDNYFRRVFGVWFSVDQYSVYKIGSRTEKEEMPYAYTDKYYTHTLTSKELEEYPDFNTDFEANQKDITVIMEKYPELFQEDDNGEKIRKIARGDKYNWVVSSENKIVKEEEKQIWQGTGYLVAVEPGKGDFGYATEEDCKNHILSKTGTNKDRWIYVETLEEIPEGYAKGIYDDSFAEGNKIRVENGINVADGTWHGGELWKYSEDELLTGLYQDLKGSSWIQWTYTIAPEEREYIYTFEYYGIKSNEILKRSLFTFTDQEDFDNFHYQVVCITPAELNAMAKKDTAETLDWIERADMFSFQSYSTNQVAVNDTEKLMTFCEQNVLGNKDYVFKADDVVKFYDNDLEWDLCMKIIRRESENKNLPLIFNQIVGQMIEEGVDQASTNNTHMFVTEGIPDLAHSKMTDVRECGTLNNISKLYLISIQFDLLARKEKDDRLRTFMEDIYPYIQKVNLTKQEGDLDDTATTTGYFQRPLCTCDELTTEEKQNVYYLWNLYTFYPTDTQLDVTNAVNDKDIYLNYGYLDTFFKTNANPFRDNGSAAHQSGSDGGDEKNVAIVSDSSNVNHASLLSSSGDGGARVNRLFEAVFQILNGQPDTVNNLTYTIVKQKKLYEKLSEDSILIDYSSEAKYTEDKTMYVKLTASNLNNEDSIITGIRLMNESGDSILLSIKDVMENETYISKEDVYNSKGSSPIRGYRVPANGSLTFYVEYSLNDWQKGYNTIELQSKSRMYNEKKDKFVTGKTVANEISIGERTLFNLE